MHAKWWSKNRVAYNQQHRDYYKNSSSYRNYSRDRRLRAQYGITDEDYDRMLLQQGGGCAICGVTPKRGERRFPVDHNHQTGRVRGILCRDCNLGIGRLKDDPELTEKATRYLRKG